jgi:hypothetical protein
MTIFPLFDTAWILGDPRFRGDDDLEWAPAAQVLAGRTIFPLFDTAWILGDPDTSDRRFRGDDDLR